MLHNMKYIMLRNIRQITGLFWSLAFPLLLGTLFHFAFGGLTQRSTSMEAIPVALVEENSAGQEQKIFSEYMKQLDQEILKLEILNEEEAQKALDNGKIDGIFRSGESRSLEVLGTGIEESILSSLLESYEKNRSLLVNIARKHPARLPKAIAAMEQQIQVTENVSLGGRTMNEASQYFFALVAMACLYGGFLGLNAALQMQANQSPQGIRCSVTPMHQMKRILSNVAAVFLLHFVEMLLVLGYLSFLLGDLDVGGSWGKVLLVTAFGSLFGVSLGVLVGSVGRGGEGVKTGIFVSVTMAACFFSGLMVGNISNMIEKHAPMINRINPAAVIADAFYCICVYEDMGRYARDLGILAAMSLICGSAALLSVRRMRYDSV